MGAIPDSKSLIPGRGGPRCRSSLAASCMGRVLDFNTVSLSVLLRANSPSTMLQYSRTVCLVPTAGYIYPMLSRINYVLLFQFRLLMTFYLLQPANYANCVYSRGVQMTPNPHLHCTLWSHDDPFLCKGSQPTDKPKQGKPCLTKEQCKTERSTIVLSAN